MLRCVKRKPNRNTIGERNGLGERNCATLPRERTHTDEVDADFEDGGNARGPNSANRPSRWSLSKKSATLSTTTPSTSTQYTRSESRSSSKSKGFNVFRASNWRTLSLSSLFSPSRKRKQQQLQQQQQTGSGSASSSGFVSPTAETEPLTGASSLDRSTKHKRPESIELHSFSSRQTKPSSSGSEATTPTGMKTDTSNLIGQDERLREMTKNACAELSDTSDHTPTEPIGPPLGVDSTTVDGSWPFVDANGTHGTTTTTKKKEEKEDKNKTDKSRKLHWIASTDKATGFPIEQPPKPDITLKKSHGNERVSDSKKQINLYF
ncbi:unnamed protein product [Echinostoma caproni]|uniref:Uncharacterized protein n=1 Tax=Echinostoma caproni TaxID=27848 RepID=A0A183ANK2_9TREM|nr:unnamed protein product [Echinostoma caproni]